MKPAGLAETAGCLAAGAKAFLLRAEALQGFGTDRESFLKCFWGPTLAYPLYLIAMVQIDPMLSGNGAVPDLGWIAARTIGYVIAWIYWPVLLEVVCDRVGRPEAWVPLIVALVWTMLVPMLIQIVLILGVGPGSFLFGAPLLAVQIWMLVVHGWLLRQYLSTNLPLTIALVLGDFILSRFLHVIEESIARAAM